MKKLSILLIIVSFLNAGILENIKSDLKKVKDKVETKVEDIKKTPIDVEIYAKNDSPTCNLIIKNISSPESENKGVLEPINVKAREYYRTIKNGLKLGKYEFEYDWYKNNKLIDSSLKTKILLPIHNIKNSINKKFDLTFLTFTPKECK